MNERPLLATGELVPDYKPLFKYWEKAKKKGLKEISITSEDIEYVERKIGEEGKVDFLSLREELSRKFLAKVDPETAVEAYRELGLDLSPDLARKMIADILAGWVVEACSSLGILKIKKYF